MSAMSMFDLSFGINQLVRVAFQTVLESHAEYTDDPICQADHASWNIPACRTPWQMRMLAHAQNDAVYRVAVYIHTCITHASESNEYRLARVPLEMVNRQIDTQFVDMCRMTRTCDRLARVCVAAAHAKTGAPLRAMRALNAAHNAWRDIANLECELKSTCEKNTAHRRIRDEYVCVFVMQPYMTCMEDPHFSTIEHVFTLLATMHDISPIIAEAIDNILTMSRGGDSTWHYSDVLCVIPVYDVYEAIVEAVNA